MFCKLGTIGLMTALSLASPSKGACRPEKLVELPVTVTGNHPIVPATINGKSVSLIADSGAFFSMITPEGARQLHLPIRSAPGKLHLQGVGGSSKVSIAEIKTFALGGKIVSDKQIIVGGNELGGFAIGVLGQNVLGLADVDYDFANGKMTLVRPQGCEDEDLTLWTTAKPVSKMAVEALDAAGRHTVGSVEVNGKLVQAALDTGSSQTILSLQAAQRVGLDLKSPLMTFAGYIGGVGPRLVRTWITTAESLQIGGEAVKNAPVRVADVDLGEIDMLIGIDFFLMHRVYVANSQHRVYFTQN